MTPPLVRLPDHGFPADAALSALEALWIAMPPGADTLSLTFELPAGERIRLSKTEATMVGTIPGELQAMRERFDPFAWHGVATMAFRRLQEEAEAAGAPWPSLRATCRMPHTASPAVILEGAAEFPIGAALLRDRIFTSALAAALEGEMPAAIERQNRLQERFEGLSGWNYSQPNVALELRLPQGTQTLRSTVIGSYAAGEGTFLWSWANRSFSPDVRGDTPTLRDAEPGVFRRAGFFCDENFALIIAMLAAGRLGGSAVFPARIGDHTIIFMAIPPLH